MLRFLTKCFLKFQQVFFVLGGRSQIMVHALGNQFHQRKDTTPINAQYHFSSSVYVFREGFFKKLKFFSKFLIYFCVLAMLKCEKVTSPTVFSWKVGTTPGGTLDAFSVRGGTTTLVANLLQQKRGLLRRGDLHKDIIKGGIVQNSDVNR